ncbi:MAG: substrate-binding domain-containing protein [Gemmatimonadetes bacterium]|nr:substrate-binding domain-containing protein [Gemmatimonadota bacterium]
MVSTYRGPEKEDDREQQVSLVQNLIAGKYDAIVLAPLDDTALVGPVKQATAAKIPVVIIDSGLEAKVGEDFVSFVATDNEGRTAGRGEARGAAGGEGEGAAAAVSGGVGEHRAAGEGVPGGDREV